MDSDREDEHTGRSPTASKSSFCGDEEQTNTVPKSLDGNVVESTGTCELSPTEELSGKENSCLICPPNKSKPLAFDVDIKEVPADVKMPFQDDLNPRVSDISDAFPVCVQLPADHLKTSHMSAYKTTHRHRKISHCSTSSTKSRLSLKAPVEDLCASVLLACLFCRFWDCVLAVGDGCHFCVESLCSSLCSCMCCCDPSSLEDLIDLCPCCSCAEYVEACGCTCGENAFDCSICDLCLQTTECLELGMELSQLMFH